MDEHFSSPEFQDFPISLHLDMIRDPVRMELYSEAIKSIVDSGSRVIDIGSGTGILSLIAAQHGAEKVCGVEISSLARYATKIAELNSLEDMVEFIQGNILEIEPPAEKFTIAICELFGTFGIDENILPILQHVREKFLEEGGKILPESLELFVAPVQCTESYRNIANWKPKMFGLDFSPVQELAYNAVYHLSGDPVRLLANQKELAAINFYSVAKLPHRRVLEYQFETDGVLHGMVGWFTSTLAPGYVLSTSPKQESTHWGQLFFPIGNPVKIKKGGRIEFQFNECFEANLCHWNWQGGIFPDVNSRKKITYSYNATRNFES